MVQQTTLDSRFPWLAIGCCASRRDSIEDDGRAALRANGESEMQICYDQPQTVAQPRAEPIHARPSTSHSMGLQVSQWVASSRDFATRASSRASIHTLSKPRKSHHKPRPSIGRPMNFQHFDSVDGIQTMLDEAPMPIRRRRSFRPLELSIYLPDGRLSPLPDFSVAAQEWSKLPAELEIPAQALVREHDSRTNSISSDPSTSSYLIQRKPIGSGSRRSSVQSQNSLHQSRPVSATLSTLPFLQEESRSRPESFVSLSSALVSPSRILSRLPSPSRSRSNTSSRPGSLRRAKTDVDEAIRELNTIVEERRADAYRTTNQSPAFINRPPPSPSHHVPTIAPSLRLRCRAETLSDIGSAFSVPLSSKPLPTPPTQDHGLLARTTTRLTLAPPTHPFAPLASNPITPPTPTVPTPTTPISRLGAWLKRSLPASPSNPAFLTPRSKPSTPNTTTAQPFYQCTPSAPYSTSYSRPSTAGSRTLGNNASHTRQTSGDTATVTLLSSYPSTPALSTRSLSPTSVFPSPDSPSHKFPATPPRTNILKGEGKTRRVPAPLVLGKEIEIEMETPLASARSARGGALRPPMSPNYGVLMGMEMCGTGNVAERTSVGVAF
ncbi:hypothetical protein K505DRAFT_347543 [Melanomma pulvis-pyrius CBS 109.77]|uniref:Uncharacterized protein n=1 Tax=Melanomma pulvis-pyrius CBS 109.77 TaxID=1314802 RepID=A0A6A6XKM6_9PLEO|nr:hypothetical protein K505DRAFT_347543 [Melanomma pulvis-pyrius CBS 109.77]